jgi:DNA-binding transcriptional MerR regulator
VTRYKLDELARAADVAARTIRYYVQRGLIPAPAFHGKDTTYGPEHLARLRAIKRLQQAHLPLDAIQARLAAATDAELSRIAEAEVVELALPPAEPPSLPRRGRAAPADEPARAADVSRWERIELLPGLELHVREGASAEARKLAETFMTQAATRPPRARK